jgi:hypothetical protein
MPVLTGYHAAVRTSLKALIVLAALICSAPFFWLGGGGRWLETNVFPPRRPNYMPANSVWIDAPPLPVSWHHGWWFGCGISPSGASNYCRLVAHGRTIYDGEFLSCRTHAPVPEHALNLVAPPPGADMWLFAVNGDGVAGYTKDGDILLPVAAMAKCDSVKAKLLAHP